MSTWTREDSTELDRIIRAAYPHRPPLVFDPAVAALIQDAAPAPTVVDSSHPRAYRCVECQRLTWRSTLPKPDGILGYGARGKCQTCYKREKNGSKPRKLRVLGDGAIDEIRALTAKGMSAAAIADIYNVTPRTVQRLRAQAHQEDEQATA